MKPAPLKAGAPSTSDRAAAERQAGGADEQLGGGGERGAGERDAGASDAQRRLVGAEGLRRDVDLYEAPVASAEAAALVAVGDRSDGELGGVGEVGPGAPSLRNRVTVVALHEPGVGRTATRVRMG
ncbi:MAG: hypothetical protein IPL61_05435 [Myxococcales bacterium]|nr:hypothetical protein [Myxococcales bacterium]